MSQSIFGMAASAAFRATREIFGPSVQGQPLLIWWPLSWPLTNKRAIETEFHTPLVRAVKGPRKRNGVAAGGAAEIEESTATFSLEAKDLPAAAPAQRGIHFLAGATRETARIYRVLVVNEAAGLLELETTED